MTPPSGRFGSSGREPSEGSRTLPRRTPLGKPSSVHTFDEFWPFYVGEHRKRATRALHFIGTNAALVIAIAAVTTRRPSLLLLALATAYGFAWAGHFFVEKNRPATFRYPLWSFIGDWKMWSLIWTGRMDAELRRLENGPDDGA